MILSIKFLTSWLWHFPALRVTATQMRCLTTEICRSETWRHNCREELRLGLNGVSDGTDRRSILPQDEDFSVNDRHWVPGFLRLCSKVFPERFQIISVFVGASENRLVYTEHPKCGTLSSWIPRQIFSYSAFYLIRDLGYNFFIDSGSRRVSWLAVPRMFFLGFSRNSCHFSPTSQCSHHLK